ncbi:UPF0394 membrane protein PD_1892-like [Gigantopelta aegis]|uniref:UPF0394 membrane protein PD_1892-like n=1 Tax=Gigantopelta aegis TaxID=1735272 RepID=UPI001B88BF7E|nr:UPF0394 membrane protein PD_1892-like [Gigantopelta aegis]
MGLVFYVCSAVIGGLSSALMSSSLASVQGVGALEAFFGGFILLFGARFGAGCTSGHGLSGMALMAWLSFLAVPFMFAGGIVTAFLMRTGSSPLDRFVNETLAV